MCSAVLTPASGKLVDNAVVIWVAKSDCAHLVSVEANPISLPKSSPRRNLTTPEPSTFGVPPSS